MLLVAWICHPLFIYALFWTGSALTGSDKEIMKMAIISLCLTILLYLVKKWALALVVLGNAFIVINDLFYFLVAPRNKLSTLLCVSVVLFTIMGTFWLFVKETRDYYAALNPKVEPPELPGPR